MRDRAYSKINLSLDVKGVRDDGYHLLETIMLPLDFFDELDIRFSNEMNYLCNRSFMHFNEHNTIVKMVKAFKEYFNIKQNFSIKLYKHIPVKAGLAGGSSDAASTLRLLAKMCHITLSEEDIKELCLKVGADVLFCYYNRPALISGIGDEYEFIKPKNEYYVLLVKPSRGVSTADAYNNLNMDLCDHPNIGLIKDKLIRGEDVIPYLGNSLEEPALRLCAEIKDVKEDLLKCGASFSLMSGSGSTVFTLSLNYEEIKKIHDDIKELNYFTRLCKVLA